MKKTFITLFTVLVCMVICGCDSSNNTQKNAAESVKKAKKGFELMTDFEVAKSQAKINNKPILLIFSGSDWCGWCVKLDQEVFSTPEFKEWAAENAISVIADFPARKELPAELKMQNEKLRDTYGVTGFPTVLLLKDDGSVIARTGYQRGGAANYIRHLKMFMAANK
jgi:thioredoxin-related protein